MRVNKVTDPVTQTVMAYTIEGVFGRDDRAIWMDGRSHPFEYASTPGTVFRPARWKAIH